MASPETRVCPTSLFIIASALRQQKGAWYSKRLFAVTNLQHLVVFVIVRHGRSFFLLFRFIGDHRLGGD